MQSYYHDADQHTRERIIRGELDAPELRVYFALGGLTTLQAQALARACPTC